MNAAGRLVHQGAFARHVLVNHLLSKKQLTVVFLSIVLLVSALSVIYVSHTSRVVHAAIQHQLVEQQQLHVQRSQLLLERSTWMMQARIQEYAEKQLGMVMPDHKSIVMIHE